MLVKMVENCLMVFCVEEVGMFIDVVFKNLKLCEKVYKVMDCDGFYV